jgi:hypothetical protein
MDRNGDEPLRDEAAKRDDWRGEEGEAARPEAGGGTLPASEDNDEAMKDGGGGGPRTEIRPPD